MDNDVNSRCRIQVTYWQPDGVQYCLASSAQHYVGLMNDGRTVLKYPLFKTQEALKITYAEADRYTRVGSHENLVAFKGLHEDGLLLEYCERGDLQSVITAPDSLTYNQKVDIGKQVARCLYHLHKHNFIHCDLHVRNVFLTSKMIAKVGDLQGQLSRHDGSIELETMSQESPKSRHPYAGPDEFSSRTDIFALGTLLYHVWYGHAPFPELGEFAEDLIQEKYRTGQFPLDSKTSSVDTIIDKCWTSKYECVSEVLEDMQSKLEGGVSQCATDR